MKRSLLLFLNANCLHAQVMAGGRISEQSDFTDTPDDMKRFTVFLSAVNIPTYLLTDLIEEDFRHEIVPHLRGGSRKLLLERKFDQFYRNTPFHQATMLHRQKTGRRDDDFLFSALTNPSVIMPWLNILLAQKIPLAGIYSVPQISAPLIADHPSSHLLLISWEKFSGLRQTYFSDHHLQISRMTPIHAQQTFHEAVSKELSRTYLYLKSLSLLPLGRTLDVRILCHRNDRDKLEADGLINDTEMHYDFTDIADIATRLGMEHEQPDSDATQIFLHQLAVNPPKSHYASATHTHYFALWRCRRALNIASITLLFGALLWSAINFWMSSKEAADTDLLKLQTRQTQETLQLTLASFPNTYAPAPDMKTGVLIEHKLAQYAATPQEIMGPISTVLEHNLRIELDELSWQMSATEPITTNTLADVPAQVIILTGHLLNFSTDYRAALNYLEQFQHDLAKHGYQVTVPRKPLDVSPSGSIVDQRGERENTSEFSLKLSMRPPT